MPSLPGHQGLPGHTVLQVPVPALEPFVRARTLHYDPAFLSDDPVFGHAHVTVLGPFLPEPSPGDLEVVAQIAAGTAPFDFRLERIGRFPNGILYLAPEPDASFSALTATVSGTFPQCPPYDGIFTPRPHLTLDLAGPDVDEQSTRTLLGDLVPAVCRAERIDLVWYRAGECRVLDRWPLGG